MQEIKKEIGKGIYFQALKTDKYKTDRISVNFIVPMNEKTASAYALLSYVMRLGSESYPDFTYLNRRLDELYGAELSTDALKLGANQVVNFQIVYIDDKYCLMGEEITRECGRLITDVITKPLVKDGSFYEAPVLLEKENLIDAIESLINDKRGYAISQCLSMVGRGDKAFLRRYGKREDVEGLNGKDLYEAYKTLLRTADIRIFCTGNGDYEALANDMQEAFSSIEREPHQIEMVKFYPVGDFVLEKTEIMDVQQAKLCMCMRPKERVEKKDQTAFKFMSAVLGGTPSSKLFLNVREKESLCYYCACKYMSMSDIMIIDSGIENENVEKVKAAVLRELQSMKDGNITDEEISNTRKLLINSLKSVEDSPSAPESWHLRDLVEGGHQTPETLIKEVENVTKDDIVNAAKRMELDGVYLLTGEEAE